MQMGYFKTAWGDIKSTPGWMGKMFLLALISCIPVFGIIVVYGYLYGWARNIAWGNSGPMPQHIFGNEDGKLYSRGFFIAVLIFVCGLIVVFISSIGGAIASAGAVSSIGYSANYGAFAVYSIIGSLISLVSVVIAFALFFFEQVGAMRISIYGRLSAGFQFKKVWAMLRHDFKGILKIFGMMLLTELVIGTIFGIIIVIVVLVFAVAAIGTISTSLNPSYIPSLGAIFAYGGIAVLITIVFSYLMMVPMMWVEALMANALGYWTRQFNVAAWRGQDDPMPFELQEAAQKAAWDAQQAAYQQQPYQPGQPVAQPYQPGRAPMPQYQQPYQPAPQPYQQQPYQPGQAPMPQYQPQPYQPGQTAPQPFTPYPDATQYQQPQASPVFPVVAPIGQHGAAPQGTEPAGSQYAAAPAPQPEAAPVFQPQPQPAVEPEAQPVVPPEPASQPQAQPAVSDSADMPKIAPPGVPMSQQDEKPADSGI